MNNIDKLDEIYLDHLCEIRTNTDDRGDMPEELKNNYSVIRKDLEVLEIIKKHIVEVYGGDLIVFFEDLSKDEIKKIGEWLNNDK